jgi:hypothetical protein
MNTPQFLIKFIFTFCSLYLTHGSVAFGQSDEKLLRTYTLYEWTWGDGLDNASPDRNCTNQPNFNKHKNELFVKLSDKISKNTQKPGIVSIGKLDDFCKQYDDLNPVSKEEIAILGFAFCDSAYLTYRIFIYDTKHQTLTHEFEYYILPNTDMEQWLTQLTDKLYNACEGLKEADKEAIDMLEMPSLARMEEALFVHRYEELFQYYVTQAATTTPNPIPYASKAASLFSVKAKHRAKEIIHAIEYYKTSKGNWEFLKKQYSYLDATDAARQSERKIVESVAKEYPQIWWILRVIVASEYYKDKPFDPSQPNDKSNASNLEEARKQLLKGIAYDSITKKNLKRQEEFFAKQNFKFDSLRQEMLFASHLLLQCHNIFQTAESYYKQNNFAQASQIYFKIMRNKEVSELASIHVKENDTDQKTCGKLKLHSYEKLKIITRNKSKWYKTKIAEADALFWKLGSHRNGLMAIDQAYHTADSLNISLSMYPKLRRVAFRNRLMDSITRQNPNNRPELLEIQKTIVAIHPDTKAKEALKEREEEINTRPKQPIIDDIAFYDERTWYNQLIDIATIFTDEFNTASPSVAMIGQNLTRNVSPKDSKTITLSLQADSEHLNQWVTEINFAPYFFESPNEMYVDQHLANALIKTQRQFKQVLKHITIQFRGSADGSGFGGKPLFTGKYHSCTDNVISCDNGSTENHKFQDLKAGRWDNGNGQIKKSKKPVEEKWANKAKNTALAYLRALNRWDNLKNLLGEHADHKLTTHICAKANDRKGPQYRFVDIKFVFSLN